MQKEFHIGKHLNNSVAQEASDTIPLFRSLYYWISFKTDLSAWSNLPRERYIKFNFPHFQQTSVACYIYLTRFVSALAAVLFAATALHFKNALIVDDYWGFLVILRWCMITRKPSLNYHLLKVYSNHNYYIFSERLYKESSIKCSYYYWIQL